MHHALRQRSTRSRTQARTITMFAAPSSSPSRSPRRRPPHQKGRRGRHQMDHRRKGLPAPRRLRQDDAEDAQDRHDELPQSACTSALEFLTPSIWRSSGRRRAPPTTARSASASTPAPLGAEKPADRWPPWPRVACPRHKSEDGRLDSTPVSTCWRTKASCSSARVLHQVLEDGAPRDCEVGSSRSSSWSARWPP